jgi:hypothetical protein
MTTNPGYTALGWIVWQIGRRIARHKLAENRVKVGATAAIVLMLAAGAAVALASRDSSDE